MIVKPRIRSFVCLTAHPEGCKKNVQNQIEYTKKLGGVKDAPKNVLIIGSSMGYGLASRIVNIYGGGANTVGVSFDKEPAEDKTGSSGYYNNKTLESLSKEMGLHYKNFNADAFSPDVKTEVVDYVKKHLGSVDLLVYSVASPKRIVGGVAYNSYLKTIGKPFSTKTLDFGTGEIKDVTVSPATEEEIASTIKVMGGEDWQLWVEALLKSNAVSKNFKTVNYSYMGPDYIAPIYRDGTIGQAKKHMEETVKTINRLLENVEGKAHVAVCKALITQASVAIPAVGVYTAVLYKVMKSMGLHEGCIEQINRLFRERLFQKEAPSIIRIDDLELREDVQKKAMEIFEKINTENYKTLADAQGVAKDFMNIFGFEIDGVDYEKEQDVS